MKITINSYMNWIKRHLKIIIIVAIGCIITSSIALIIADTATNKNSKNYTFDAVENIPICKAALLLGTSKYLRSKSINPYYAYRIDATVELYNSGKISNIVISGDNSHKDYNEPQDMKDDLMRRGIPSDKIILDYAGFNTYDSVYRMKLIFGQDSFIVVSQRFHNQRAIYIAQWAGLKAYGYNARDVNSYNGIKVSVREKFARVKMFIDLLSGRNPKFLGKQIEL